MITHEPKTVEQLKDSVQVDIQWTENGGYELPPKSSPSTGLGSTPQEFSTSAPPDEPEETKQSEQPESPGIRPSAIIYMPAGEPPRALITDSTGTMIPKVISYLDILYMLEESAVIKEISKDPVQTRELPPLPEGAQLVSSAERLSGDCYTVTGVLPPEAHMMPLDEDEESQIFQIFMPHLVYRISWDECAKTVTSFALAVLSPEHKGPITHETEVYAYPFSNTYDEFGGLYEGVCWPVKRDIKTKLHQVPNLIVRAFLASPNTTGYTQDVEPLLAQLELDSYAKLLQRAENMGSIPHDWLKPAAMNIRELHDQTRRES